MKTMRIISTTLLLAGVAGAASAADDPLLGTWNADLGTPKPGQSDIASQTLSIKPAPGGYSFHTELHPKQGDAIQMDLAVVPDGRPHSGNTPYGPISSTCRRTDPRSIDCATTLGGSDTTTTFALSTDGKTLSETDINEVQHVHYSSTGSIAVDDSTVTQGPIASSQKTTVSKEAETTVFHKQ
jgi:hypothetical protein